MSRTAQVPICNGATKGAAKLAALGYRAKEMIGGLPGWETDGLPVETGPPAEARSAMQNGSREIST